MPSGMKKVFATRLTDKKTTDVEALGTIRFEGNKVYKWVQYQEGNAATPGVAGEVAYYYTLDGYKLHQVTSDLTDSLEVGAGVLQAALADAEYGWIQIRGEATLTIALSTETDGASFTPTGSGDGTLEVTALVTDHLCAIGGDTSDKEIICDFPF